MNAKQTEILLKTTNFVKRQVADAEAGHDWQHIQRVLKNAEELLNYEQADTFIVKLGCLLHDIADAKFHDGNEKLGPKQTASFLTALHLEKSVIDEVVYIVKHSSFKSDTISIAEKSIEFQIVQDADRLDALGAIGIARTFNYGGYKNRAIFNAEIPPKTKQSKAEYKASNAPTINHFYEKLLLLKDQMNTKTGKQLAQQRHEFMLQFLNQFYEECGKPNWA
ncbi:HD domain-containing protein [Psychroflexus salis]|uniref:Phosphohydrolase n=1 Tax=Psychroflexus salis TaxID=1526574 RepID=A0A917EBV3_9FLAO|nr:HD domain-containing protein [Psychroflexus salis]GGE22250.1 phosphohydrolase [Psychroflexus salis]